MRFGRLPLQSLEKHAALCRMLVGSMQRVLDLSPEPSARV